MGPVKPVFVFDCGGVLMDTYRRSAVTLSSLVHILPRLALNGFSTTKLKKEYFTALSSFSPNGMHPDSHPITDEFGIALPGILCDWMLGTKRCAELYQEVKVLINNCERCKRSRTLRRMVKQLCKNILDPERFIKTQVAIPLVVHFMRRVYDAGHRVFILSNYNDEAWDALVNKYPELEMYSHGQCISAKVHLAKPDPAIYHKAMHMFDIDPHKERVIFVDDQLPNREAARLVNWIPIHPRNIVHEPDGRYSWREDDPEHDIAGAEALTAVVAASQGIMTPSASSPLQKVL